MVDEREQHEVQARDSDFRILAVGHKYASTFLFKKKKFVKCIRSLMMSIVVLNSGVIPLPCY